MMENHNNTRAVAEIMENAMHEFSEAMAHREQLSIRIGRRTTQIIRFGMAGLSILGLALFYLIFILTKDFSTITGHMERMSGNMYSIESNFAAVARDMHQVQQTLLGLNDNVRVMPAINGAVQNLDSSLLALSNDLHSMVVPIHNMNSGVGNLAANLQLMNRQFTDMNVSVGHMSGNMNQMAKPMKMFPFQ
jgi:hypothetical protein